MKKKKGLGKGITLVSEPEEKSLTYAEVQERINVMFEVVFDQKMIKTMTDGKIITALPLTKLEKALK